MTYDEFSKKLLPLVTRGDYARALKICRAFRAEHPDDFDANYQYAKILGDWADELPAAKQKSAKREAVKILKPLTRKLRGKPMRTRFGLCLNFYYQAFDWRGMYAFAKRFDDRQRSLYGQALAAGLLAYDLKSRSWAEKSIAAWKKYDLASEDYYFAHYMYAKALAVAGRQDEAMKRLTIAARKGKRPLSDWEFADVVALCRPVASARKTR